MSIYRYRQYRSALKALPIVGQPIPYGWGNLPQKLPIEWMPYSMMFSEFSQEIANTLNELRRLTHQLTAWRDVVKLLNDKGKLDVVVEFVGPVATVALNLPYVIKARFFFTSAHLCHQANLAILRENWSDDLPLDNKIEAKDADARGVHWKKWTKLKARIEKIGDQKYKNDTRDFRNAYNHRFSPRVIIGVTGLVARQYDASTNSLNYVVGQTEPLPLDLVVQLLEEQSLVCFKAFEAFQKLVREHESAISAAIKDTQESHIKR